MRQAISFKRNFSKTYSWVLYMRVGGDVQRISEEKIFWEIFFELKKIA